MSTRHLYYFNFSRISSALMPPASSFLTTASASDFFASSAAFCSAFAFFASSLAISFSTCLISALCGFSDSRILYTQLFNLLCDKADDEYGGRLPVHVRCLLDEFANIGQIPKFEKLIATIRSREISASIILQSQSQLKAIYKDNADTIVGNCDTTLFLGGKEKTTLKEMSEILGKETIDSFNTSENRGREVSHAELFKTEDKKRCTECGTFFVSKSNSVKYCPDCRKRITRRQAAERMRKRRAAVTR